MVDVGFKEATKLLRKLKNVNDKGEGSSVFFRVER